MAGRWTTGQRGAGGRRLSDDFDLRPIADSNLCLHVRYKQKNVTYFFENRSIILRRTVTSSVGFVSDHHDQDRTEAQLRVPVSGLQISEPTS